jgi:predicted porin
MQKKIIALAIAGLASTAAFAQSNVTVYGVVDAAYVYTHSNGGDRFNTKATEKHGNDFSGIQSGQLAGSRIGFKGTEDLGNGLKAIFVLEYALDVDGNYGVGSSASGLAARQQLVGLSSKAGTLSLGRQYAPGYYTVAMDATVASPALSSVDAGQAFLGATIRAATPARWNNSVNLATASMGGVTVQGIYAFGENTNEIEMGASYGVGIDYAGGPVAVKYVYHNAANAQGAAAAATFPTGTVPGSNNGTQQEHYIGLSFDAKVVKIVGSAQMVDKGSRTNAGGQAAEGQLYQIGAIVPVGKGNIHTTYAFANKDSATRLGPNTYRGEMSSVNVAYTHGLSKRTTLYTGVRYTDNDVYNAGGQTTAFGAGINHSF